jgi:hypothetical protein
MIRFEFTASRVVPRAATEPSWRRIVTMGTQRSSRSLN